jgi:hypothetical protein
MTRGLVGVLAAPAGQAPDFVEFDRVAEPVARAVPKSELRRLGIGEIKRRVSRPRGAYVANGCVECDAVLGSFWLREALDEFLAGGGALEQLAVARWVLDLPEGAE